MELYSDLVIDAAAKSDVAGEWINILGGSSCAHFDFVFALLEFCIEAIGTRVHYRIVSCALLVISNLFAVEVNVCYGREALEFNKFVSCDLVQGERVGLRYIALAVRVVCYVAEVVEVVLAATCIDDVVASVVTSVRYFRGYGIHLAVISTEVAER